MSWNAQSPLQLFLYCLGCGIVIPLPEDLILLIAGWSILQGQLEFMPALIAATFGILGRDSLMFWAGRYAEVLLERWPYTQRWLQSKRMDRARHLYENYGIRMLILTRFAVGMRPPLYVMAGMLSHRPSIFLLTDLLGLLITTPLTLWLGWCYGETAVALVESALGHTRLLLGISLGLWIIRYFWKRSRV